MKKYLLLIGWVTLITQTYAQIFNPVKWQATIKQLSGQEYLITYSAMIDPGWAVYSQYLESDEGPVATAITYENPGAFELVGKSIESGHKKQGFDDLFDMNVTKYTDEFHINQTIKNIGGQSVKGYLTFMTCDDTKCLPPADFEFNVNMPQNGAVGNNGAAATSGSNEIKSKVSDDASTVVNNQDLSVTFNDVSLLVDQKNKSGLFDPVHWSAQYIEAAQDQVVFKAKIDNGWHIYDQEIESEDGPTPTEFWMNEQKVLLLFTGSEVDEEVDEYFGGMLIKKIKKEASYTYDIPKSTELIKGEISYSACDNEKCTFPLPIAFTIDPIEKTILFEDQDESSSGNLTAGLYPVPPIDLDNPIDTCGDVETANVAKFSLLNIFFLGFVGGLLALLTPCVFPMIPLTVSFFTKGSENKKTGMRQAFLYGFFILLVYLLLSLPFHLLDKVNPGILNDISTNVTLNVAFFVIFIFFAFSFFGYYELTLPSKWTNKVSNAESVGGFLGVFFMALTLALVSFSCTGPILGSLLAGALTSEGGAMQLTAGMGGFGLALALPFAFFAAFPTMLSAIPKSGGWLNTVKVVLGFLELALAFKFLSNADLVKHWGLLKIEPFLAIWIVIFIGLAIYLFGRWRFPHDGPIKKLSMARIASGAISLAFAIYLITGFRVDQDKGTFKSLTLLSGLAPPAGYSWIYPKECPNNLDCFKDLTEGIAFAKKVDKPIMIDFTGHACQNCRKMEEHVWPQEGVNDRLKNDFVLISLYVDEKIELPEDQKTDKWRNYGQKWQSFQTEYFNNNSQPYYVLLSPEGKLLNNPVGYTPDVEEYTSFLECGLSAFREIRGRNQIGKN